jgi:hypothetical protein
MAGMMFIETAVGAGQMSKFCPPSVVQTLAVALHDSIHDPHLGLADTAGGGPVADDGLVG